MMQQQRWLDYHHETNVTMTRDYYCSPLTEVADDYYSLMTLWYSLFWCQKWSKWWCFVDTLNYVSCAIDVQILKSRVHSIDSDAILMMLLFDLLLLLLLLFVRVMMSPWLMRTAPLIAIDCVKGWEEMVDSCLCLKNDNNVDCVFGNNNYILLPLYWMFSILPPPPRISFIVVFCEKCQSLPSVLVEVELSRVRAFLLCGPHSSQLDDSMETASK